jgi:phosphate uptake regulator
MNLRKVQEISGTYLLSIPITWARRSGLTKGSIVALVEREDGCIIVDPQYRLENNAETTTIHPNRFLEREITGKYLLGFDIIKVAGETRLLPEISERVRTNVRRLIGLEIIEEDAYKIVLQCLLEPSALPPERILRREQLLASSMHRDVLTSLNEGNAPLARSIVERDEEVDRLYFLLVRLLRMIVLKPYLSEKLGLSMIDCLDYRLMANYIEAIADYSQAVAEKVIEFAGVVLPKPVFRTLKKLGELSYDMHQDAFKALLSKDLLLIEKVLAGEQSSENLIRELDEFLTGQSFAVMSYASSVASALTKICGYSVDLADLVIP